MKVLKGFGIFFAVIYSILFFVVFTVFMSLCCTMSVFREDFYTKIVKSINLDEIKMSDLNHDDISFDDKDLTIEEYFTKELEANGVDSKTANEIVTNEKVREVLGGIFGDAINYFVYGGDIPQLDSKDVKQVIDELDLEEEIKNNSIDIDQFVLEVNKVIVEEIGTPSSENSSVLIEDEEMAENINELKKFTSGSLIWFILAGFIIGSYLWLCLLTWSFKKPLTYIGIPVLITGIIFLIIRLGFGTILTTLVETNLEAYKSIFNTIISPVLYTGLGCSLSGIIMIIARCLIRSHDDDKVVNNALNGQNNTIVNN